MTRDGAGAEHWDRDAERIAAEVATALARLRDDLRRHPLPHPAVTPPSAPAPFTRRRHIDHGRVFAQGCRTSSPTRPNPVIEENRDQHA